MVYLFKMSIIIQKMTSDHWPVVSEIYIEGISTGNATFEQNCPDWKEWDENHRKDCRIVAIEKEKVVGWAALSNVSGRCIYSGVCEVSVYVSESSRGKGIGKILLKQLISESEKAGIWTLQAGIFPENKSSINLHKKLVFREVGIREKIGKMNGVWRDVILLEKRSLIF